MAHAPQYEHPVDSELKAMVVALYCSGEITALVAREIIQTQGWEAA